MKESIHNKLIYHRHEMPFGKSWEEWTVLWWKWLYSIPREKSPAYDTTGKNFEVNQRDPHVVFLTGTFKDSDGPASRHCIIPHEKAIFLPVINYSAEMADEHINSESQMQEEVRSNIDDLTRSEAFVDGIRLDLKYYRVHSPLFQVNLPENNVAGLKAGITEVVSDGYWLFLTPLPIGKHEIGIGGTCQSGTINIDAKYDLAVK